MALGAHMSISGGIENALIEGQKMGCETIQIFTKNNMQWKAKRDLAEEEVQRFKEEQKRTGIAPVVSHDTYLINLASPDAETHRKSMESFMQDYTRTEALGLPGLIMHPGAHMGKGDDWGLEKIADSLNQIMHDTKGFKAKILLETTAGQGSNVGYRFEHLARIIELSDDESRLGICFDTCHVFAAGYDISTKNGYEQTMRELDKVVGLKKVVAFHLNDSMKGLGSRVDRHEHIGKGALGLEAFRCLLNDKRFKTIPKILETPKGVYKGKPWDKVNLKTLRELIA